MSQPVPQHARGASAEVLAEPREAARDALEGFHWLFERASIYPVGHPVVEQARDRTAALFGEALAARDPLTVRVGRGAIAVGPESLDSLRCRSLGSLLFDLDVVSLEFRGGLRADEILDLARELARLRGDGGSAAVREKFRDGGPFSHLRIGVVDYGSVRYETGTQERPVGDDPERMWNALSQTILGPPDSPRTVAPEQLADLLGDEILRFEDVGASVLNRQLQRLLVDIEHLPAETKRDAHARVGRFLTALPKSLREELLRIDARTAPPGAAPRTEPLRPDSVVTTLLFGAVRQGDRPPQDTVALMNQLLRNGTANPERREHLDELLARASSGEADDRELDELGEMVRELFRNRENIRANPGDYQALVDSLARDGASRTASAPSWTDRYGDPRDPAETLAHAVEIAGAQFADPDAEKCFEDVVEFLRGATDRLIDDGRFETLRQAVRGVDEHARTSGDPSAAALARGYLEEVTRTERIQRMLQGIPRDKPVPDAVLDLVERAGSGALESVLDLLESGVAPEVAAPLHEIILSQPAEQIVHLAKARLERGWRALRPLFPVLRRATDPVVLELLVQLLMHPDEKVRSHALATLPAAALDGSRVQEVLLPVLRDASPRMVRAAIRKLGGLAGRESVELLRALVENRLPGEGPTPLFELRLLAVRVLTLKGAAGWECLGSCLGRLGWRLRADDIDLARFLSEVFRRRSADPAAARILRRWGRSPARLLGFLVPRGNPVRFQVQW